jgi:CubicO group peptidase (beta-lactamase class C family)
MNFRAGLAVAAAACASSVNAEPVTGDRLATTTALVTRTVDELLKVPGGIAGYSVVIAADGHPDFILTRGVANAATGAPVTPDTAFYIASQTKSYTGLLAAHLDRKGVFPLDTTMAQVWPGLKLPAPADPAKITFRQLLSHNAGFETPALQYRTAYTDDVALRDYPVLLSTGSMPGKPGFEYSNTGYLLYAAALQKRTGRHWKSWLDSDVFSPLALNQTYSRSSKVPPANLAWGHQWDGTKWVPVAPKQDAIMHAAGGTFASSRDLAKWIRWQLSDGEGQSAIPAADFRATKVDLVGGGVGEGGFGIECKGYGLGWSTCSFAGAPMLYHGGTYSGVRTHLFMLTDQKVGVAISANSDGMTGTLGQFFMSVIASSLLGQPEAGDRATQMIAGYRERVGKQVDNRKKELAQSLADPRWAGWAWAPDRTALAAYEGRYRNPLFGELLVRRSGSGLEATVGVKQRLLRPAKEGLFGTQATPVEMWEPVQFTVAAGKVDRVSFDGQEFTRVR